MEKHYTSCFKILALSLLLSLVHSTGFAQKKNTAKAVPAKPAAADTTMPRRYRVGILAKAFGDSVVIRWAPNHAALFRQALRSGYMLTRRSFNENKKLQLDWQVTVRPWTATEWQQQVSKNDTLAAACSQLVNGTNTPIGAGEVVTLDKILDQQNQNDLRMMLSLILADVNPRNARGMALGWVDKKVAKGASYIYYIVPLTDQQLYPVDPAGTTVMNEKSNEQARMLPVKTSSGEHIVHLKWNRRMAENAFSSYFIERSDDGGKKFRRLTKRPWMQAPTSSLDDAIQYTDSVPQNYRPYKYRIFGITPFGELVPSEIITASSLDKTPPPTVAKLHAKHVQGTLVKVSWDYPDQPKDLGGFVVAKGMSMDGPFTPLTTRPLTSNAREFLDTTALPHLPNYYRVVAIDTARNAGIGLPVYCLIKDLKGPSKPTGLQGYIDTTGFVRIVWEQNPEPDIYGYRVIAANAPDHVFTGKTNGYLALPAFNDTTTLNALTPKKYFRVIAYDKSYNPSEPSEILELKRPDVIRPVAPVLRNYVVSDTAVLISWVPSSSVDVSEQIVLRRGKATERWTELARLDKNAVSYADQSIKGRSDYGYALVAVDDSGLRSDISFPLNIKTPKVTPATVDGLKAFLNPDKSVSLYWTYGVPNCRFVIYKAGSGDSLASYDSVYDTREYRDKRPQKGRAQYMVRVIYQDGMESGLSKPVEVEIK